MRHRRRRRRHRPPVASYSAETPSTIVTSRDSRWKRLPWLCPSAGRHPFQRSRRWNLQLISAVYPRTKDKPSHPHSGRRVAALAERRGKSHRESSDVDCGWPMAPGIVHCASSVLPEFPNDMRFLGEGSRDDERRIQNSCTKPWPGEGGVLVPMRRTLDWLGDLPHPHKHDDGIRRTLSVSQARRDPATHSREMTTVRRATASS